MSERITKVSRDITCVTHICTLVQVCSMCSLLAMSGLLYSTVSPKYKNKAFFVFSGHKTNINPV